MFSNVPNLKLRGFVFLTLICNLSGVAVRASVSLDAPSSISAVSGGYVISGTTGTTDFPQSFFFVKIRENGTVASEFGLNGRVSYDFVDALSMTSVNHLIDSTGRIFIYCSGTGEDGSGGGVTNFSEVHCFDSNGRPDQSFADRGVFRMPENSDVEEILLVLESTNGKLLVVSRTITSGDTKLLQLGTNGVPDDTFGTGGWVTVVQQLDNADYARRLIDGRILLSSRFDGVVIISQTGIPDASFANPESLLFQSSRAIGQQADGKILIGEERLSGQVRESRIRRFSLTGSLDTEFGTGGTVVPQSPFRFRDIVETNSGSIWVLAGAFDSGNQSATWIHQLSGSGVFDSNFGSVDSRGGREALTIPFHPSLDKLTAILPLASGDQIILSNQATATFYDGFRISRFSATGELDQTFASGAVLIDSSFPKPLLSYLPIERGDGFAGEYRVPISRKIETFRADKSRKKRFLVYAAECGVGTQNYRTILEAMTDGAAKLRTIYAGGGQLFGVPDETAKYSLGTKGSLNNLRPYRTARLLVQFTRSPRGSGKSNASLTMREITSGANSALKFRIVNPR